MPDVTVLLVASADAEAVAVSARSLFAQTLSDFELLVLDAGTGESAALAELAAGDWRLSVVPMAGAGLGDALNRGVALAQGRLIGRVTAGDVVAPERLERQAALLGVAPELAFVGTGWREVRADGSVRRVVKPPAGDAALRAAMATGDAIGHPTAMMRREAVTAAGGWRPAFAGSEDYDLLLRLLDRHTGACVPQVLVEFAAPVEALGWQALEQRFLSEMGAMTAHDRRQVGRPDHGEQVSPLDRGLLHRMGMTADEIAQGVTTRALSAALAAGVAGEWRAMREAARLGMQQEGLPRPVKSKFVGLWLRGLARMRPALADDLESSVQGGQGAG